LFHDHLSHLYVLAGLCCACYGV